MKLTSLKFVYETLNKINPQQFHTFYSYPEHSHKTKTAKERGDNLDPPSVRTTTYGLKGLKYSGCKLWNDLPMSLRHATSKNLFSKNLKDHFISKYIE